MEPNNQFFIEKEQESAFNALYGTNGTFSLPRGTFTLPGSFFKKGGMVPFGRGNEFDPSLDLLK